MPNLAKRAKRGENKAEAEILGPPSPMEVGAQTGVLTRQRSVKMMKEESTTSMYAMFNNTQAKQGAVGSNQQNDGDKQKLTPMV